MIVCRRGEGGERGEGGGGEGERGRGGEGERGRGGEGERRRGAEEERGRGGEEERGEGRGRGERREGESGIVLIFIIGWSDTTNTASRMESNGFCGCVQVTPAVYDLLKERYSFTRRGMYI